MIEGRGKITSFNLEALSHLSSVPTEITMHFFPTCLCSRLVIWGFMEQLVRAARVQIRDSFSYGLQHYSHVYNHFTNMVEPYVNT